MAITTDWTSPPQDFVYTLLPGNVHVWRATLDDSLERASSYRPYLSTAELDRADRCRAPHPQYQFVVTRGILRVLLSRYMEVHPAQLQFENQPQGKPGLLTTSSSPIQFNVAHTRGMAFIAVTNQHNVGIDVEWIDRKIQDRDIAERYFSARESEYLASLSPPERTYQFFSYWTCKEAYLKMQGRGIGEGLAQCELTMNPDQSQIRLTGQYQQDRVEDCSLSRITSGSGYVGAVAIACSSAQVSYWNWEEEYLL